MPEVPDPYEERGVPHPHALPEPDEIPWTGANHGASNIDRPPMTQRELAAERRRLRAREARRIRPGFYRGTQPHDQ